MYGEAGTDYIYDSLATRARLRDKQDLCYNEDIYQTIFPPKQPRLSLADAFAGAGKKNKRKLPIEVMFHLKLSKKIFGLKVIRVVKFVRVVIKVITFIKMYVYNYFPGADNDRRQVLGKSHYGSGRLPGKIESYAWSRQRSHFLPSG